MTNTKVFYSVDVETTSTNPFNGQLLSVGVVPIDAQSLEVGEGIHIPLIYDKDGPIDPDTYHWWKQQSEKAFDAAWGVSSRDGVCDERFTTESAAQQIVGFVKARSPKWEDSIFCANPVSFDFPWIQKLFAEASIDIPFHYRTLCMRSMYFGIVGGDWGQSRSAGNWNYPKLPHHALEDARAQALDLVKMMMMTHSEMRPSQTNTAEAVSDVYD